MTTVSKAEFFIEMMTVYPIEKIITQLENREFRDCDIKWLNKKLNTYTGVALEIMGKEIKLGEAVSENGIMNDNVYGTFLKYFKTLHKFFKSIA